MAMENAQEVPTNATVKGAKEIREEEEARVDASNESSQTGTDKQEEFVATTDEASETTVNSDEQSEEVNDGSDSSVVTGNDNGANDASTQSVADPQEQSTEEQIEVRTEETPASAGEASAEGSDSGLGASDGDTNSDTGEGSEQTVADQRPAEGVVEPAVNEEGGSPVPTEAPVPADESASEEENPAAEAGETATTSEDAVQTEGAASATIVEASETGGDNGADAQTLETDSPEGADTEEGEVGGSETGENATGDATSGTAVNADRQSEGMDGESVVAENDNGANGASTQSAADPQEQPTEEQIEVRTEETPASAGEASAEGSDSGLGAPDGDTNSETETNKELSLEEWQIVWKNDERLFREKEKIKNTIDKNKEPEKYRANQEVADLFYHIVRCDGIMKANEIGSENFNKAIAEREEYYNRDREITASLDELHSEQIRQETDGPEVPDAEGVADRNDEVETNATGDEEKAETEKPAKKTEAEILYQKDLEILANKKDILKYWENVQAVWQADYNAATRKIRDRSKRARCSYEILRAEAQKVRASKEVEYFEEIVKADAKMVDAEKEFGVDSEQYIKAKNERERLYKLYQGYIDEVGEVQEVDRNKKGIIKDGDQRGQDRLNLKPAKPSKLKAFWNKIKKPLGIFVAVAAVVATVATGVVHGTKYLGKKQVDNPNTNTPIEQPDDDSKDNESVEIVDKEIDTDSLTDEDKQQIEDELEQAGSITSMVKIDGVEGISYRKDGDVEKVNIYISTKGGSILEYQSQITKDEISEFAKTEGVEAKDVVDLILSGAPKTYSSAYKKLDETKYSQLINNIYSDAEDIEFPDPGKDGNYTSYYYKIDNTRSENGDIGNVDFLAIGPDSVVKVDDRVEYQTATGKNLNLRDPSALLNMIEKSLGGNASTSGFSGKVITNFDSSDYFKAQQEKITQKVLDDYIAQVEEELTR